jgi:hypothetical protein
MKKKEIIKEQATDPLIDARNQLLKFNQSGCFPKWLVGGTVMNYEGKKVWAGKNSKNQDIVFFLDLIPDGSGRMISQNIQTKEKRGWSCDTVGGKYNDILTNFGITKTDAEKAKQITKTLQGLIDQNAVSNIFQKWNEVLTNVFKDTNLLTIKPENALPAKTSDLQIKYQPNMAEQLNSDYGWKNISIYLPQAAMETPTTVDMKLDETTCDTILKTYLKSAFQYAYNNVPSRPDVLKMQGQINSCYGSGMYNEFSGITGGKDGDYPGVPNDKNPFKLFRDKLRFEFIVKLLRGDKRKYLPTPSPYIFHIGGIQNESMKKELKTMIKESLYQSSKLKKQNLITESNIIGNRTKFLIENRELKTESQRDKFFNEILIESNYLNSQGFSEQLINEQFWDALKGLFGTGAEGTFQYFKEYLAKQLITKLTPLDTDGWIGGIVVKAVGNVDIADMGKLTNCNFLVPVLTKSIVEEAADKIKKSVGMTGPFYDILRNSLAEMVEHSDFGQSVERNLSTLICPLLGGVKNKIETATDKMKEKVLSK